MVTLHLATIGNEHAHFVPNGATYRHEHEHACADFDSHPGYCHCHPYIDFDAAPADCNSDTRARLP